MKQAVIVGLLCGVSAFAQFGRPLALRNVGIDQKLNAPIPLDLPFEDEAGRPVKLGQYFGQRPVVLALVYYQCPMLCNMVLDGMLSALKRISLEPGKDFEILTVSFDPRETPAMAAAKKQDLMSRYNRPGAAGAWHFLTGADTSSRALADAVGFHYAYDPLTNQYAHASGIMVLTPDGHVARYLFGITYQPTDLRLALVEASKNKIGSPVDQILLLCYCYNPATGKYGFVIMNVLRALGTATVFALGMFMFVMLRRDRRNKQL